MTKLFLKTFFAILFISSATFAGDYCVVSQDRAQGNLVQDFLGQLQPKLPKNLAQLALQICYVVDHDPTLTNTLMSYSAEFDRTYRYPSKVLAQDTKNMDQDFGIKINLTAKFIKLLEHAKVQRGEKVKEIQPQALSYAGSFVVRSLFIANKFKANPLKDIRKSATAPNSAMSDVANDHEAMTSYVKSAIEEQQSFVDEMNTDTKSWAYDAGEEFLDEKIIQFNEEGQFVFDPIVLKGQYRPAQIVYTLTMISTSVDKLKKFEIPSGIPEGEANKEEREKELYEKRKAEINISDETIQEAKRQIQELNDEWNVYFNPNSEVSAVLQDFVMVKALDRFKERYVALVSDLPKLVKPD